MASMPAAAPKPAPKSRQLKLLCWSTIVVGAADALALLLVRDAA